MSHPEHTNPQPVTTPTEVIPDAIVSNRYPGNGHHIDRGSADEFAEYLNERMYGRESTQATTYIPGSELIVGTKTTEWGFSPRRMLRVGGVILAATVALFAAKNVDSGISKSEEIIDDISAMIDPPTKTVEVASGTTKSTVRTITIPVEAGRSQRQKSGIAEPSPKAAKEAVDQIISFKTPVKLPDGTITRTTVESINIEGRTSDDWGSKGDKSLGNYDQENTRLGNKRAEKISNSLEKTADNANIKLPNITKEQEEIIISRTEITDILVAVHDSEYPSFLSALSAHKNGNLKDNNLKNLLDGLAENRYGLIRLNTRETTTTPPTLKKEKKEVAVIRKDEKHPVDFPLLPLVGLLAAPLAGVRRKSVTNLDPFMTPGKVVTPDPEVTSWVQVYDRAVEDNKIQNDGWSDTRKYQYLMRENRISQALVFEYADDEGEQQRINVLFTDRDQLSEELVETITDLMFKISLMQGGKIGKDLDTVVIYPSEQAGQQSRPDQIGLGIDDQYDAGTLGVAIPVLGLVEMHIPTKLTADDIKGYEKTNWVFAHEVAGHFTDIRSEGARNLAKLPKSKSVPSLKATYGTKGTFAGRGTDMYTTTGSATNASKVQFGVRSSETATYGTVFQGDPKLQGQGHTQIRLHGVKPTAYANTNALEVYAETAAAVTTGEPIPPHAIHKDEKTLGVSAYSIDVGLHQRFADAVGANTDNFDALEFSEDIVRSRRNSFTTTHLNGTEAINSSGLFNPTTEKAKDTPYQPAKHRVAIGTKIRY